ncbi:hypothetical protein HMPREF9603_00661 [Cutibacterium acnes HL001PA1]|nr:hypothetical protein HMPREF9603_00661 [Cutibacterium acnes HL001PA1]EFT10170.1 hypothetical protein HMPREF9619_01375 [Cutibacterium acnes HL082PA2]
MQVRGSHQSSLSHILQVIGRRRQYSYRSRHARARRKSAW